MMTIATQCEDRREMVRKLSEFLSQPAIYLRAPTYAFRIGGITVNRDASVSGAPDHLTPVARFLLDNGYISELPAGLDEARADSEDVADDEPGTAPADEQPADSEAPANPEADEVPVIQSEDITGQVDRISVSLPLTSCTAQGLVNILRMLYTRQNLIAAMTQCDFIRMDEEVIDLLNDSRPDSIAQISELLRREAEAGMVAGVAVEEDKLKLDTCYKRENPAESRRFRAAAARFSRFPPGTAPRLPPETRPLCAVSRRTRPLLPRQPGFFPLCARALPAIPPVLCPKPPHAPQPPTLGARHRPELGSRWGFHPARLHRFAVVKRVSPPPGGPQSLGAILRRPPPSRLRNFAKFKAFFRPGMRLGARIPTY